MGFCQVVWGKSKEEEKKIEGSGVGWWELGILQPQDPFAPKQSFKRVDVLGNIKRIYIREEKDKRFVHIHKTYPLVF